MRRLVIIHVNPHWLSNKLMETDENENTYGTVNWIRAALKVTAGYIPAANCVLNINQTTKDKVKIT